MHLFYWNVNHTELQLSVCISGATQHLEELNNKARGTNIQVTECLGYSMGCNFFNISYFYQSSSLSKCIQVGNFITQKSAPMNQKAFASLSKNAEGIWKILLVDLANMTKAW